MFSLIAVQPCCLISFPSLILVVIVRMLELGGVRQLNRLLLHQTRLSCVERCSALALPRILVLHRDPFLSAGQYRSLLPKPTLLYGCPCTECSLYQLCHSVLDHYYIPTTSAALLTFLLVRHQVYQRR